MSHRKHGKHGKYKSHRSHGFSQILLCRYCGKAAERICEINKKSAR